MTDREVVAIIVAFAGTWVICVYLAFWISELRIAVKEVQEFALELAHRLEWGE